MKTYYVMAKTGFVERLQSDDTLTLALVSGTETEETTPATLAACFNLQPLLRLQAKNAELAECAKLNRAIEYARATE
jgi:hypothetical protein